MKRYYVPTAYGAEKKEHGERREKTGKRETDTDKFKRLKNITNMLHLSAIKK